MGKKFLVLGGAGDMGSSVVSDLATWGNGEITIGDINERSIDKAISKLRRKGIEASGMKVDVADRKMLQDCISKADVIVNTVGPFYRFEEGIVEEVGRHEVDYVDICDDYDVTSSIFLSRKKFENVKGREIIGMGWTPGITNVCARDGFNELDTADEINIAWVGSAADAAGKAVIEHTFHAVTGDVPMFLDGKISNVPARQFHREIDFPEPIGKVDTYYTGHPEPITIPLFLKGVKQVTVRGSLVPDWQNHLVSQFADIGMTENKIVNVNGTKVSSRQFLVSYVFDTMDQFKSGGIEESGFWVEVKGRKGGKRKTILYSGADRMKRMTGIPAAIAAEYLAENRSLGKGIYAPEGAIDPGIFFRELKKRKIIVKKYVQTEEF
jgi:saccharopine dehydrogenase-like NADP-dependent oxidoreductase